MESLLIYPSFLSIYAWVFFLCHMLSVVDIFWKRHVFCLNEIPLVWSLCSRLLSRRILVVLVRWWDTTWPREPARASCRWAVFIPHVFARHYTNCVDWMVNNIGDLLDSVKSMMLRLPITTQASNLETEDGLVASSYTKILFLADSPCKLSENAKMCRFWGLMSKAGCLVSFVLYVLISIPISDRFRAFGRADWVWSNMLWIYIPSCIAASVACSKDGST